MTDPMQNDERVEQFINPRAERSEDGTIYVLFDAPDDAIQPFILDEEHAREFVRVVLAALPRTPDEATAVPAGMVLVPQEPTEGMCRAGGLAFNDDADVLSVTAHEAKQAWSAMLAAAPASPKPPASDAPEVPEGMVPWHGDQSINVPPPADWDGGPVAFADGSIHSGSDWDWGSGHLGGTIIAYTPLAKRPVPAEAGRGGAAAGGAGDGGRRNGGDAIGTLHLCSAATSRRPWLDMRLCACRPRHASTERTAGAGCERGGGDAGGVRAGR